MKLSGRMFQCAGWPLASRKAKKQQETKWAGMLFLQVGGLRSVQVPGAQNQFAELACNAFAAAGLGDAVGMLADEAVPALATVIPGERGEITGRSGRSSPG